MQQPQNWTTPTGMTLATTSKIPITIEPRLLEFEPTNCAKSNAIPITNISAEIPQTQLFGRLVTIVWTKSWILNVALIYRPVSSVSRYGYISTLYVPFLYLYVPSFPSHFMFHGKIVHWYWCSKLQKKCQICVHRTWRTIKLVLIKILQKKER